MHPSTFTRMPQQHHHGSLVHALCSRGCGRVDTIQIRKSASGGTREGGAPEKVTFSRRTGVPQWDAIAPFPALETVSTNSEFTNDVVYVATLYTADSLPVRQFANVQSAHSLN